MSIQRDSIRVGDIVRFTRARTEAARGLRYQVVASCAIDITIAATMPPRWPHDTADLQVFSYTWAQAARYGIEVLPPPGLAVVPEVGERVRFARSLNCGDVTYTVTGIDSRKVSVETEMNGEWYGYTIPRSLATDLGMEVITDG
jgi:hypothetical protein